IQINDVTAALPVTLDDGKIRLYQSGRNAVLETDFGLRVTYEWQWHLVIHLPSSYYNSMCGLCGNFNGNSKDERVTKEGTQAPSVVEWAKTWRVKDRDPFCWDQCKGNCPTCSDADRVLYRGDAFCGQITKKNGAFHNCHGVENPDQFFDNCLYDVCLGKGAKQIFCQALDAYATTCQESKVSVQGWRKTADCPLPCPENSHYDACGTACPSSCGDIKDPAECKLPCVESCQCNDGFVLSAGKCVSINTCGCNYQGRNYKPNEEFWGDAKCLSRCKCNPTLGMVVCENSKCKHGDHCTVVDGVQGCYPLSYHTCSASGDPHYYTFDKRRYDFQGTCVYQFAALCAQKSTDLTPFKVHVQNEHRGNKAVAYTKLVEIQAYDFTIVITKSHAGKVMVNNLWVNLPYYANDNKLRIFRSGWFAVVQTSFGVRVAFDWKSRITVTIPSSYAGAVCGLCGNFNRDPKDDLTMKDGQLAPTPTDFGKSWRTEEIPGCVDGCKGKCPSCDVTEKRKYESNAFCGKIKDPSGPFRECHSKIDPAGYFEDCAFDVCFYRGRAEILCQAITSYVSDCQDAGVTIYAWRTQEFCSATCAKNSHYELCSDGCPVTCNGLSAPVGCVPTCKEDCQCDEGFVLSGEQCVPVGECGCEHGDKYYKTGEVFYPSGLCKEQCTCKAGGGVHCRQFSCGKNEECKVKNGVQKCQAIGHATCSASGDPHYISFDGKKFDFQGTCTYTLAKTLKIDESLTPFSVKVQNVPFKNKVVSVTKLVAVEVYGTTLILTHKKKGIVMVDGIFRHLPLILEGGKVRVYQHGVHVAIETDFGLLVRYNLVYQVSVRVPGNYIDKMGGLCGNYNGDKNDDFMLPGGQLANDITAFGAAWKIPVTGVSCNDGCGSKCPSCSAAKREVFEKEGYCGILIDSNGPFEKCHGTIDPRGYFNDCLYDLCAADGEVNILCESVQSYVSACQAEGITLQSWRSDSFCPLQCPANSHYKLCADTCSQTCVGITDDSKCPTQCAEGCECDDEFFFDGENCIPMDQCGCFINGNYYKPDEVVFEDDCKQKCSCSPVGGFFCEDNSCASDEKCEIKEGIQACYNKGITSVIQCMQFGGGGGIFHLLVGSASPGGGHKNKLIKKQINDVTAALPVTLDDGKIRLYQSGRNAVLETDFGLRVTYEWQWHLVIHLPSSYYNSMCGLCGNFNGNSKDERVTKEGTQASSVVEWAKTWRVKDRDPFCWDQCKGNCPTCSDADRVLYRGDAFCGQITKKNGAFHNCHGVENPDQFFDNCLYDVCLGKGAKQIFCQALDAYATTCQESKVSVQGWRKTADCPLPCPENSHYDACGTACPSSCGDIKEPADCNLPCVESCQCNDGFVLSAGKCVSINTCGCNYQGRNYKPNEEFWGDAKCLSRCKCNPTLGMVVCENSKCKHGDHCTVVDGVQGCYPLSYHTCSASGDPHYYTFDKRRYDFQGTCVYQFAALCAQKSTDLTPFKVHVQNEHRGNKAVAYTKLVEIQAYDFTIVITKSHAGKVMVRLVRFNYAGTGCRSTILPCRNSAVLFVYFFLLLLMILTFLFLFFFWCVSFPLPAASCQSNSHYELDGTSCPITCNGLSDPVGCESMPKEGCQCDTNFVLSGEECVPLQSCGCLYKGKYYKLGEVLSEDGCKQRCQCGANGVVVCVPQPCGANEECKVVNGVHGCHPKGCGKCVAAGDPHYLSFDGRAFDFQGTCTYTLAKSCGLEPSGTLVDFSVDVENEQYRNKNVAVTRLVAFNIYGSKILMEQGVRGKVKVDDVLYNLPLLLNDGKVWINQEGNNIILRTDFGLKLLYDAVYYVTVSVPGNYRSKMCGLCGNFNGDKADDYVLPGGEQAANVDAFGAAWKVTLKGAKCSDGCGDQCPACPSATADPNGPEGKCAAIADLKGAFADCFSLVKPEVYLKNCRYDVCAADGDQVTLCKSIQAYAIACQVAGAKIKPWRSNSFCPLTCPANSHYELCADTCENSCAGLSSAPTCSKKCFEGCQCDDGFVSDGEGCVPLEQCGCTREGLYYKANEVLYLDRCTKKCQCLPTGVVVCEETSCPAGQHCTIKRGIRGCYKKEASCSVKPGAHLQTFDGLLGDVPANSAYELAFICNVNLKAWFRVVADVRACAASRTGPAVAVVYTFFENAIVAVNTEKETFVNGRKVQLPAQVNLDINVSRSQDDIVVEHSADIRVVFKASGEVTVTLGEAFQNNVCGACGNFNWKTVDDLTLPDGKAVASLKEVISAWRATDFSN
uniref:Fc gamma binding protein n=1 Tax=Latimeria chalumnae TaxID=7897 RepID=H3AZN9_LATCH